MDIVMKIHYTIYVLIFLTAFQGGFLFKCYWDYMRAPVPLMTTQDFLRMHQDETP